MTAQALGTNHGYCFQCATEERLSKWQLQDTARELLPKERIRACHRIMGHGHRNVTVSRNSQGHAWYSGIATCNSVWICPVCAERLSAHRRDEVQKAIDAAIAAGEGVTLITLTHRHHGEIPLKEQMARKAKALRRLKSGRAYVEFKREFGIIGEIRALEVTHGDNGWHPHTHAITFTEKRLDTKATASAQHSTQPDLPQIPERPVFDRTPTRNRLTQLKRRLYVLWYRACEKEGLPLPSYKHGVDVRSAKYAADYIAKWGFASELTRAHIKNAKGKGRNPWELLSDAARGDKRAGWLFREFAQAFKGRNQLLWSRGLRERYGLKGELTEQQIMELEPDDREEVITLDAETWTLVVKYRARETVLHYAAHDPPLLQVLLEGLRAKAKDECGSDGRTWRRRFLDYIEDDRGLICAKN